MELQMPSNSLGFAIVMLIGGTSLWIIYFSWRNSFSSTLLPILYPIAGASLASLYIWVKTTYVDAPKPRVLKSTIAVLQETESGKLYSMSDIWTGQNYIGTSPLFWIDAKGQDPNIVLQLKSELMSQPVPNNNTTVDIIEFAIFHWLNELNQLIGFRNHGVIEGVSGVTSGGELNLDGMADIPILSKGGTNPFLQNIKLKLPAGSNVIRKAPSQGSFRQIEIHTPKSEIKMIFPTGILTQSLDNTVSLVAKKVIKRKQLSNLKKFLKLHVFQFNLEFSQPKSTRFSSQATREWEWLNRIADNFILDFSWISLRERLSKAPELPNSGHKT